MNTQRIRELNDAFRRTFTGGQVMLTSGVDALPPDAKTKVLQEVRTFDAFDNSNDPHHEHDFGAFEIDNQRYFWKVDYYKRDLLQITDSPVEPQRPPGRRL
jgi:hypothetical protein